jgi:hypothetical protein
MLHQKVDYQVEKANGTNESGYHFKYLKDLEFTIRTVAEATEESSFTYKSDAKNSIAFVNRGYGGEYTINRGDRENKKIFSTGHIFVLPKGTELDAFNAQFETVHVESRLSLSHKEITVSDSFSFKADSDALIYVKEGTGYFSLNQSEKDVFEEWSVIEVPKGSSVDLHNSFASIILFETK